MKSLQPTHPYVPIGRGFLYLVAIMDWPSRAVLGRWPGSASRTFSTPIRAASSPVPCLPECCRRLWRSLKHEEIYLKGYADGPEAKAGIASWIAFYNARRPHQALGNRAPGARAERDYDQEIMFRAYAALFNGDVTDVSSVATTAKR